MRELTNLEAVILAIIRDHNPTHGFFILKEYKARMGPPAHVGNVYRVLLRLNKVGFIESFWEEAKDASKHQGPRRRYHKLTREGRRALENFSREITRVTKVLTPPTKRSGE